ncbi:hypothetical protein [Photobacterium angustum]|uniref:hypothetical protein n=1 Tax=Photobacterium angustum TaxID=661 RepID=UPI0005E7442D|nr:hypothetical protein [Photobacterium angustum]KJG03274.1 hypothetical protein UB35_00220 [Photobacterium angustum]PSV68163.1 hypothetical protein CTM95_05625 [Photobacterium angustum]
MNKWSLLFLLFLSGSCLASDVIYLNCDGIVTDSAFNKKVKNVKNDFLINKNEKYIQQIITGMTEEQTEDLRHSYVETATQYVTKNGFLSINRHTLEYSIKGVMGMNINGVCRVLKPAI